MNNSFNFDGTALKCGPHAGFDSSYILPNYQLESKLTACYLWWLFNIGTWHSSPWANPPKPVSGTMFNSITLSMPVNRIRQRRLFPWGGSSQTKNLPRLCFWLLIYSIFMMFPENMVETQVCLTNTEVSPLLITTVSQSKT